MPVAEISIFTRDIPDESCRSRRILQLSSGMSRVKMDISATGDLLPYYLVGLRVLASTSTSTKLHQPPNWLDDTSR